LVGRGKGKCAAALIRLPIIVAPIRKRETTLFQFAAMSAMTRA
jgi:hypothetical protein